MRFRSVTTLTVAALVLVSGTAHANESIRLVGVASSTQRPGVGAMAVTYNEELVPLNALLWTKAMMRSGSTSVQLTVRGLLPQRAYGAHVHVRECGVDPAASGPHVQHVPDPVQPSVDPAYANPSNELWLDFTTDASGTATATAEVPWELAPQAAGSVVVHETPTHTEPGPAGTAGARVACLTVPF
jgi:Cu-Zn family superoxide dismutase